MQINKIAIIGNMNNNGFALMRYFRDLGADAHLLLYANDGKVGLSHFSPECDTWDFDKWKKYIHQTNVPNTGISACSFPISTIWSIRSFLLTCFGRNYYWQNCLSRQEIIETYDCYNRLIGSGIAPANLYRIGRSLDVFFPYASGVEFLATGEFLVRFKEGFSINRLVLDYVSRIQSIGIRSAKTVVNGDVSYTNDILKEIGVEPVNLLMPMLYEGEAIPENPPTKNLQDVWCAIKDSQFSLLHHARLMWVNPGNYSSEAWKKENKKNDLLLYAFAEFIKLRPGSSALLLMVEYGPDVEFTKKLATEIGLQHHIYWLPQMDRRELLWLLTRVSVGVGEFYDIPKMIWGGTGWEVLASGKPLLQGFNFDDDNEFNKLYGYPPPPLLAVRTCDDIVQHLINMFDYPHKRDEIGLASKDWFSRYNGISLAKKWLALTLAPRKIGMNKIEEIS